MHVCVYVCMYVCMHVCMSVRDKKCRVVFLSPYVFCMNINNTFNCFLNDYVLDGKCIGGINNTV